MFGHPKSLLRRLFKQRLFFAVNLVLFLFLAIAFGREYWSNRQIQSMISQLETQASQLEARNIEVAGLSAQLETEAFLEREARLRLGLAKPGERVVVVSEESDEPVIDIGGEKLIEDEVLEVPIKSKAGRWWAHFFDQQTYEEVVRIEKTRL